MRDKNYKNFQDNKKNMLKKTLDYVAANQSNNSGQSQTLN